MGAESLMLLALLGLAALYALLAIKRVGQNERLIIFQKGKPVRVGAPGLVITWPLLQSSKRMDMRTRSMPLPNIQLAGIAQTSIVSGTLKFHIIDPLKAAANADVEMAIEKVVHSTLLSVVPNATIKDCLTESFILENQTLDLVNRQAKSWGVKVSVLSFSDFPMHRRLVRQLAGMLAVSVTEIAEIIEKAAQQNDVEPASERN